MALSFSPYFSTAEQTLDRVMLAQHVNLTQDPLPPVAQPNPVTAPPTKRVVHMQPLSTEHQRSDSTPNYVSTNPVHMLKYFVESKLLGNKNEHAWFWFIILFVFCIVMLGLNMFLVNKVNYGLDLQSRLLLLASTSK